MLYIVKEVSNIVDGSDSEPIYMFCNSETGTLHFRKKSALATYGKPILGVNEDGTVTCLGDITAFNAYISMLKLSNATNIDFYTSQLRITGSLSHEGSITYTVRSDTVDNSDILILPVIFSDSFSWLQLDMYKRMYKRVLFSRRVTINLTEKPFSIKEIYMRVENNSSIILSDLAVCFYSYGSDILPFKESRTVLYLIGDNLKLLTGIVGTDDGNIPSLDVICLGSNSKFIYTGELSPIIDFNCTVKTSDVQNIVGNSLMGIWSSNELECKELGDRFEKSF